MAVTIYKTPITLYWDSIRASKRDTRDSGQWHTSGVHQVENELTVNGVKVYAIKHPTSGYGIGWVREDDLGNEGINTSSTVRHTVIAGDTLWSIANQYNTTVNDIRALNGLVGDLINVGQVLIVKQTETTVIVDDGQEIIEEAVSPLKLVIDGKEYPLVEGVNHGVFELPPGATEIKIVGSGNVKFRYRPEVMG